MMMMEMSGGSTEEEYFVMPVGFKFLPTEEQLLSHFLYKKVMRELSPADTLFVKECDIYGDKEPWQIWDENGGRQLDREAQDCRDLYLFTQLKHKDKNGSKMKRTVGGGTWSGESKAEIYSTSKNKILLGLKKRFTYKSKTEKKKDGNRWIILEYSLDPNMLPPSYPNKYNYVICMLRKPSKKRKLEEEVKEMQDDHGRAKRLVVESHRDDDLLVSCSCPLQQVSGNRDLQYYGHNTSKDNGSGGSTADVTNEFSDSPSSSSSLLDEDFLDNLFQGFASVQEAFPDLFGDVVN